jgi:hypothetical protein
VKQREYLFRQRRMLGKSGPHVVLRERDADLTQIARECADKGNIAPAKSGPEDQCIVAIILGNPAHDHQEPGREL